MDKSKLINPDDTVNSTLIFIQDIKNYTNMILDITKVTPSNGFSTTTPHNKTVKILPKTVGFHQSLAKYFQDNNMSH